MKRHLVTGCTGFIGKHLLHALAQGYTATRGLTRQQTIDSIYPNIDIYHGDLSESESLTGVAKNIDTIIHAAGHAHTYDPAPDIHKRTTVEGTRSLLAEAEKHGVKKFIYISSVKSMPDPGNNCLDESETGLPADAYGRSRREAEDLVLEAGQRTGMHVCILRPALVYGPGCKGNLLNMMKQIDRGRFPPLPETGNRRSMVDVRDLIRAILISTDNPAANGRVFIITDGEDYSTHRIYTSIVNAMGRTVPRLSMPAPMLRILGRAGDVWEGLSRRRAPFNSRICSRLLDSACYRSNCAEQHLGFRPKYRFEDALPTMVVAYRSGLQ